MCTLWPNSYRTLLSCESKLWQNSTLQTKDQKTVQLYLTESLFHNKWNIWGTTKCGFLTATVNKLANVTSIHLGYNALLPLLYNYTLYCKATLSHTANNDTRLTTKAEEKNRSHCLLCLAGHGKATFKGGYEHFQYPAIQDGYAVYWSLLFQKR